MYLTPSFYPYRVPVFDALYRALGDRFVVVSFGDHYDPNVRTALRMGAFPRQYVNGRIIPLSRRHNEGQETPMFLIWAASLPWTLASLRPGVVFSINFSLWTLTSVVMGFPTVIGWEGTHHTERTVQPWRTRLRRQIAERAKGFVVNGVMARDYLCDALSVGPDRIIEGGLCSEPPPQATPGPKMPELGEEIEFLFVGKLIGRKGLPHLLHATQLLQERLGADANFRVLVLGDGPERHQYTALARELEVQSRVCFANYVSPDQVWQYYARGHVFVLPTLQDNWPLVVPEAMSMGLPVLLSNRAGSVPDLIRQGENGFTFKPEDHNTLASFMEYYVRNPQAIRRHGERSLEIVSAYTPQRVANVILTAIDKAQLHIGKHDI